MKRKDLRSKIQALELVKEQDDELKRSVERRLTALEMAVSLIEIRKGVWKPKPQQ